MSEETIIVKETFAEKIRHSLNKSINIDAMLSNNVRLSKEEFVAKVISQIAITPKLQECSAESIVKACIKSAQYGLPIDANDFAYLIPRYSKESKKMECNFQLGYKGLIELVKRNPNVMECSVDCVYSKDEFRCWTDETGKHFKHVPDFSINRDIQNDLLCVFAFIRYKNGGFEMEVMNQQTVEKVKGKATQDYIWKEWYSEKAKVAVLKRLCKKAILMNIIEVIAQDNEDNFNLEKDNKPKSMMEEFLEPKEVKEEISENDAN